MWLREKYMWCSNTSTSQIPAHQNTCHTWQFWAHLRGTAELKRLRQPFQRTRWSLQNLEKPVLWVASHLSQAVWVTYFCHSPRLRFYTHTCIRTDIQTLQNIHYVYFDSQYSSHLTGNISKKDRFRQFLATTCAEDTENFIRIADYFLFPQTLP